MKLQVITWEGKGSYKFPMFKMKGGKWALKMMLQNWKNPEEVVGGKEKKFLTLNIVKSG